MICVAILLESILSGRYSKIDTTSKGTGFAPFQVQSVALVPPTRRFQRALIGLCKRPHCPRSHSRLRIPGGLSSPDHYWATQLLTVSCQVG